MKASEARLQAKKANEQKVLEEQVNAFLEVVKKHCGQGRFSCQVPRIPEAVRNKLCSLGYKIENYYHDYDGGLGRLGSELETISW